MYGRSRCAPLFHWRAVSSKRLTVTATPSLCLHTSQRLYDRQETITEAAISGDLPASKSRFNADHGGWYPGKTDRRMRLSQIWAPTGGITPEENKKGEAHSLLIQAGFIRQAHAGIYHLLPHGLSVQKNLVRLVQNHLSTLGAGELSLSSISSEALWKKSGRIKQSLESGQHEFLTVQDRKKSGYILSPTHEEEITSLVSSIAKSYKDYPLRLYQISRKYRDELRPRQGLLRTKEFIMKDLYTFDLDESSALATYQAVRRIYRELFNELTIPFVEVEASSGDMGGSLSHEFHFLSPIGEDTVLICESCGYAANEEIVPKASVEEKSVHICPRCSASKLSSHRAIEIGHTFHLGTRYSEPLNASVAVPATSPSAVASVKSKTEQVHLQMGCHGIGISRLIGAIAAMTADSKGLCWPIVVAPYQVVIVFDGPSTFQGPKEHQSSFRRAETKAYDYCRSILSYSLSSFSRSVYTIIDDRDKPLSWKLKDADLIGYPIIVVMGRKWKETGEYEIQCRSRPELSRNSPLLRASVCNILNELSPGPDPRRGWHILNPTPEELSYLKQNTPTNGRVSRSERDSIAVDPTITMNLQSKATGSLEEPTMQRLTLREPLHSAPNPFTQNEDTKTSVQATVTRPQENSGLTREHLLERVTLLERLMALRTEEEELNNKGSKGR